MKKFLKGDKVKVLSGKHKGAIAVISSRVSFEFFLLEGLFLSKKHEKPNPSVGKVGGIVNKQVPVHQSKLALVNPQNGKPCRVGFSLADGKVVRVVAGTAIVLGA